MTATVQYLAAAREIASHGVRVVPLFYGQRFPTLAAWPNIATTDTDELARLFADARVTGVGIVTGAESGVFTLDVDPEGFSRLEAHEIRSGRLPTTATVATRRGVHLHFRHPFGVRIPTRAPAPLLGVGLDVKGAGGCAAAPPTPHASGCYSWLRGLDELADAPAWLLARVVEEPPPHRVATPAFPCIGGGSRYGASALARESARVSGAKDGARHATTVSASCSIGRLVGGGEIERARATDVLVDAAVCAGLPEREARRAVADGLRRGIESPRRRRTR